MSQSDPPQSNDSDEQEASPIGGIELTPLDGRTVSSPRGQSHGANPGQSADQRATINAKPGFTWGKMTFWLVVVIMGIAAVGKWSSTSVDNHSGQASNLSQPKSGQAKQGNPGPPASKSATNPADNGDAKPTQPLDGNTGHESEPPTTPLAQQPDASAPEVVPSKLKHDGYAYYGLGNHEPMNMEETNSRSSGSRKGTRTIRTDTIENDSAVFILEHAGGIAFLGHSSLRLEKGGIYVLSQSGGTPGLHDLEFPAAIELGFRWRTSFRSETLSMVFDNEVTRFEKVTTKRGTYDALLISVHGTGLQDGAKTTDEASYWYVKDRGNVKFTLASTDDKGNVTTITVQETP